MQQEEQVKEVMRKAWEVLETSLTSGGLFQPWTLKLGAEVLQGVRGWDCMGTVGVFPKPSKYLCLKIKIKWSCRKMGWRRGILLLSNQAPPKGRFLRMKFEALFTLRLELEPLWGCFFGWNLKKERSTDKSLVPFLEDFCFLTKVGFPLQRIP